MLRDLVGQDIQREWFDAQGELADWSAAANLCFAPGCEAQSVFVLASFAAPIMSLLETQEGGAFVSIYGGKKAGKDFAQLVAETVWAEPGHPASKSPADRPYLPVFLPDLVRRDPVSAHKTIVGLILKGEGVTWRTMFLTINPIPLFDAAFKPEDRKPGLEFKVRVPPPLIDPKREKPLRQTLMNNRATAGYAFIKYMANPAVIGHCRRAVTSKIGSIRDRFGDISERRFEARAIAAIVVAAQVVQHTGILDVSPERIENWLLEQVFQKEKTT